LFVPLTTTYDFNISHSIILYLPYGSEPNRVTQFLILFLWKGGGGGQGNNKQQQEERMKQMEDMKNSILSQVLDQEAR
jgi:hypothetical protein